MAMPQIDDTFVRRFAKTLIHIRRFRGFYAIGAVWLAVMAFVPNVRNAVTPLAGDEGAVVAAQPIAASASAAGAATSLTNTTSGAEAVTDLLSPVSEDLTSAVADVSSDVAPDVPSPAAPSAAGAPPIIPPPPYIPLPAVPEEIKPGLLAVSPLVGGACDTIGTAALLATVGSAAVPPEVPLSQVFPYFTPIYIACGSIPRLDAKAECEIDATLPNPVADQGLPVSANVGQILFDQLRAIELALATVGAPNPGLSSMVGAQLGCVVPQ